MALVKKSHTKRFKNMSNILNQHAVRLEEFYDISNKHLIEVYHKVDKQILQQKLKQNWNTISTYGIVVLEDEEEVTFKFNAKWKGIKMEEKFHLTVLEREGLFVFLNCWLPTSIEISKILPEEEPINKLNLLQIIKNINIEVQAFHSRSEQLKELENGAREMKVQIFSPDSRNIVVLKMTILSSDTDNKYVYSLILKYKSYGFLPYDVSLDFDDMPKEVQKTLLHQASAFKKMILWKAFRKYTGLTDSYSSSSEDDY